MADTTVFGTSDTGICNMGLGLHEAMLKDSFDVKSEFGKDALISFAHFTEHVSEDSLLVFVPIGSTAPPSAANIYAWSRLYEFKLFF